MRIKVFALLYGHRNESILQQNLLNAGMDYDFQEVVMSPLYAALNYGLSQSDNYDAITFLANDIIEPNDWLKLKAGLLTDKTGIVSIYPFEHPIPQGVDLIGNYLINSALIKKIGYFTSAFGVYGPLDLDYCNRARVAGFTTIYVPNAVSVHAGANTDDTYGFSKAKKVSDSWAQHCRDVSGYLSGEKNYYIG